MCVTVCLCGEIIIIKISIFYIDMDIYISLQIITSKVSLSSKAVQKAFSLVLVSALRGVEMIFEGPGSFLPISLFLCI